MNFWDPLREAREPTDRLERDPLSLSIENAQFEYFADMAFDERLLALLENAATSTSIDITHVTPGCTDLLSSRYFGSNTFIDDENTMQTTDAYAFRLSGVLKYDKDTIVIDAHVNSEVGDYPSVKIQSHSSQVDCFYLSKIGDEFDVSIINTKELFTILCQLAGAKLEQIDNLMDSVANTERDNLPAFQLHTEELWSQMGQMHGTTKTASEVTHQIAKPANIDSPEKIKLRYEELESPDATVTKLFLEHSTEMPELDAQESYCLSLIFEQIHKYSAYAGAEKVIVSGITPNLIAIDALKKSEGRVTKLDLDDINIKGMFVDWFDQMVSLK